LKGKKEIIIGIVSVVAIFSLAVGFFFLKGLNLFKDHRIFYVKYANVQGLTESSAVNVNGFKIGQIGKISYQLNEPDSILVQLIIDNNKIFIPEDTQAELRSDILGTRSIELLLGQSTVVASEKSFLTGLTQKDLQDQVNEQLLPLKNKTEELIGNIDEVIMTVNDMFTNNKTKFDQSFSSMQTTIKILENTTRNVDSIVYENRVAFRNIMSKVESITTNLKNSNEQISRTIDNIAKITDSLAAADFLNTIENAKNVLGETNQVLAAINNKEGSLGKLIYNDSLINNVNKMVDQAQRLIENIKDHPNRYLQFSVFGSKSKGVKLDARDEKALKDFLEKYRSGAFNK
jgi:phospholipid/cholesterol/gamma-HCH transport system substrate-binding protein